MDNKENISPRTAYARPDPEQHDLMALFLTPKAVKQFGVEAVCRRTAFADATMDWPLNRERCPWEIVCTTPAGATALANEFNASAAKVTSGMFCYVEPDIERHRCVFHPRVILIFIEANKLHDALSQKLSLSAEEQSCLQIDINSFTGSPTLSYELLIAPNNRSESCQAARALDKKICTLINENPEEGYSIQQNGLSRRVNPEKFYNALGVPLPDYSSMPAEARERASTACRPQLT